MPQMHLHLLQRPGAAAAPAEARRGQTLPVPALLLRQRTAEAAGGASTPGAQGQMLVKHSKFGVSKFNISYVIG